MSLTSDIKYERLVVQTENGRTTMNEYMSVEEYQDIKSVPTVKLAQEYNSIFTQLNKTPGLVNTALAESNIMEALAHASQGGYLTLLEKLVREEIERRDAEDGPMSAEESEEMLAMLFEVL